MEELPLRMLDTLESRVDVACSCGVLLLAAMLAVAFAFAALSQRQSAALAVQHRSIALPRAASAMTHWALDPLVRLLVAADVSANAVTGGSLLAGAAAGAALAMGHFGVAGVLLIIASLGDALDGLVARGGNTESAAGALFDASVDRYGEFFAIGGLAIFFRESGLLLALALSALMGSFMVSYGSAKAEALRVPVPPGAMRRAERATCLCLGTTMVPLVGAVSRAASGPEWVAFVPAIATLLLISGGANVSAVRRIRLIAARASPKRTPKERIASDVVAHADAE